ncbi:MAG TPA: DUF455 family protein [Thermoanaerobaculia bacterium]|nr:DUF455 family protein [Thermoanaerobaculia bacterium]
MDTIGYFEEGGVRMRLEPAREECFRVVRHDTEMYEYGGTDLVARREAIHRHMSNEMTSLDIAAQCVADFPDAPWPLRMELARQCWDESRHVVALYRRLLDLGGKKGEFPISAFEWCVTCAIDNLPGRLASQNRTFEAGAMDVVGDHIVNWRAVGDGATADILDAILADEIQHVRFANRWIRTMADDDPRVLMKIAMAVRFTERANGVLRAKGGEVTPVGTEFAPAEQRTPKVNIDDRKLAGFSDEEIHEILRQAGFRTLIRETAASDATV